MTLEDELNSQRILVFIEREPQSNIYSQIILTADEFKIVSDSIGKTVSKDGNYEYVEIRESEEEYKLPDLKEIYTIAEITK